MYSIQHYVIKFVSDLWFTDAVMDHSDNDCFACAILSHGEEGIVYGKNGKIDIKKLLQPFKGNNCDSLAGKPKLFFIQVKNYYSVIKPLVC
jgi:hypothetical protein